MSDESIAARIERLVNEEKQLRDLEQTDRSDPDALDQDTERLRSVEVELDQCWDLLRQRRALRDAGADPNQAQARDASSVRCHLRPATTNGTFFPLWRGQLPTGWVRTARSVAAKRPRARERRVVCCGCWSAPRGFGMG